MYSKFGQFIDGKWHTSEKNETYEVINPATEEVIGKASKATKNDVLKALKSAEKGFQIWKKTPAWQRSYKIRKIADLMRERKKDLAINMSFVEAVHSLIVKMEMMVHFR